MSDPAQRSLLPDSVNLPFVEALYAEYLRDPASVPPEWQGYFAHLAGAERGALRLGPSFRPTSIFNPPPPANGQINGHAAVAVHEAAINQDRVDQLIRAHRVRGHILAQVDPLHHPRPYSPELKPAFYGFSREDLDRPFSSRTISGKPVRTLREILLLMRNTYCRSIGAQFMHIDSLDVRHWLQERMESTQNRLKLTREEQLRILTRLTDAVIFEEFIQKKFTGAKRFSLEGAESLIPLLDLAIEHAGNQGADEVVIGMAHRGRLNTLANIMGKSPRELFRMFAELDAELYVGKGDVKYHLGHAGTWTTQQGHKLHLALCFNPSHLEFVNPVVLGRVRAMQDRLGDRDRERSLAILVHGDAAFAGEGIVQETLNLSELEGYRVGGCLHVIVNNQLGFTTTPREGRSTIYATDVAKMLQSPIFHVNGEDPEAVAQVVRLALDFRRQFKRDVVIDMYGYRRFGHNESDEPSFTQPVLYRRIAARKTVREGYLHHLLQLGGVTREEADRIARERREWLERELADARVDAPPASRGSTVLGERWKHFVGGHDVDVPEPDTGVDKTKLAALLEAQSRTPPGFKVHPKLTRLLELRRQMARGEKPLDWAAGESLAFASLCVEGMRVRLSGQDSGRGTFSHRHAVLHDYETSERYIPLQHLAPDQAPFEVFNSPLSEAGVLGFDYGFALAYPDALVLWEAQFGDFVNTAQVYIDQFISGAEDKWFSLNGIALLLPHGQEGQGPEHSSCRLERFLQLCAEDNMQVCCPSTPAQMFHLLRRQVVRPIRKPLIVLTPKSFLRHPQAVSTLDELASGRFQRVLPDATVRPGEVRAVLMCMGKIYYELLAEREKRGRRDVALVRVEQFYPLRDEHLQAGLAGIPDGTPVYWTQEEPLNMGAAPYFRLRYGDRLLGRHPLGYRGRPESSSPATGSSASFKLEQARLMESAFQGL